jgi:hypothetical protein
MTATAPQPKVAKDGDKVFGVEALLARRAMRRRVKKGFFSRQAVNADI